MVVHTVINLTLMFLGAVIMLVSIIMTRNYKQVLQYVPKKHRKSISTSLFLHQALMTLFFIGYVGVMISFFLEYHLVTESFVSIIFFLGAIFVCIGVSSNSRLFEELQGTLQGVVPICAKCKKIRTSEGDPFDQSIWKEVEVFLSSKADVGFSHGYCPQCFLGEMKQMDKLYKTDL